MKMSILAVGAHADDVEMSWGGTILKYLDQGYSLTYVLTTNNMSGEFAYLDENGNWQPIEAKITPDWPYCDEVFFQPHNGEFIFTFPKVTTTAIRVIGDDAILEHWHKYTKAVSSFISITELEVYEAK